MSGELLVAACVLTALVASIAWTVVTTSLVAAAGTVVCSVLWVLTNQVVEGFVLVSVNPHRGLTSSDLLSLVGIVAALDAVRRRHAATAAARVEPPSDPGGRRGAGGHQGP